MTTSISRARSRRSNKKCLVPTLSQGDIVVMDNLPAHKGARVEQLIKSAGAELRVIGLFIGIELIFYGLGWIALALGLRTA